MAEQLTLVSLDEYVKKFATVAEAVRKLGDPFEYQTVTRWLRRETFADRAHRLIAAERGVTLPERPRNKR